MISSLVAIGIDWISGGEGDDRLFGGFGDDTIFGDGGNDTLHGEDGADLLFGGHGDDVVFGGSGRDVLDGGDGEDKLSGGGGDDALSGAAGSDHLHGGDGNDLLSGQEGEDRVFAEIGDDTIVGDADSADDIYDGGSGIDTLDYSAAKDAVTVDLSKGIAVGAEIGTDSIASIEVLLTGDGNDTITGAGQTERISAGGGGDTIVGDVDAADAIYDGGSGIDTLDYSAAKDAVTVDLSQGIAVGTEIGTDSIASIEILLTGDGNDTITGTGQSERISAGGGGDYISDGGGCDTVNAGDGDDTVFASLDAAADNYAGGAGVDTLDFSETMSGVLIDLREQTATGIEIGADLISGFEAIIGGGGDDHFVITEAPVSLQSGAGSDLFEFESVTVMDAGAQVVHDILDFMVGDRIQISKYEIFKEVMDSIEDRFEDIYGNQLAKDDLPIRIRHEQTDNIRQTLIDVDFDQDNIYDMTINISGDHILMVIDNA